MNAVKSPRAISYVRRAVELVAILLNEILKINHIETPFLSFIELYLLSRLLKEGVCFSEFGKL
jgi:hypothetical protein